MPIWPFILISALIAAFFAIYAPRHNRKCEASNKFRQIVLEELKELYPEGIYTKISGAEIKKILKAKHPILNKAVLEFRSYLFYKKALDKAWEEYSGIGIYRDTEEEARYNHYSITGNDLSHFSNNPTELFKKNVNNLLKQAKIT